MSNLRDTVYIESYSGLTSQPLRVRGDIVSRSSARRYHARLRLIDDSSIGLIDDIGYNLPCTRRGKFIRLLRVHTYVSLKINGGSLSAWQSIFE